MADSGGEAMVNLERHRLRLEEATAKLQQALKHWKTWELEYETLKEEIQHAKSPSPSQMLAIGRDLGGSLVNEKEVAELLGKDKQAKRTATQVVEMISRRVDYVQQNVSTVEKHLQAAERKLEAAEVLLEPDIENEEGLPLMDIQEELDEEGNVVSSTVLQPGKAAPEILETLRKAGLKDVVQSSKNASQVADVKAPAKKPPATTTNDPSKAAPNGSTLAESIPTSSGPAAKKSVSFSEDAKPDPSTTRPSSLTTTGYNEDLAAYTFNKGKKVIEVDEDDNEIVSYPIIPTDESPQDTALRRQMLQYNLDEVGQVVAEIDLDGPAEYDSDEMDEDYGTEEDEDEVEDEDQYGRSTRPMLTEDYKQQMMDLERKLNAKMLENVGPRPDTHPLAEYADDVRKLVVQKDEKNGEPMVISEPLPQETGSKKKSVRFADNLDVSLPAPIEDWMEINQPNTPHAPTISDTIIERSGPTPTPTPTIPSKPTKVSRFKTARSSQPQPPAAALPIPNITTLPLTHQGPPGRPLSSTIIEHAPNQTPSQPPDDLDPVLLSREIQTEYHKMRNKVLQQQDGFALSEEDKHDPLMEERDGKVRKVSRFRAARLRQEGVDEV
ncbi:uncharacterized protein BDR25DRAFT_302584 [Lindgomyces ingoldianus]|uniref:Uncharacterized protein n=1 Tax=Lindgomyces ingoldianus TaxID=673940 RepID=A0ACB6R1F5_9PLEO|nr:uncharacterized protein BDR25DRAFT_302584 [Lindgomyces ingoldianus]KAF2472347.1 hypothetical protein BDR25DRAFT_302584 [Lindgomyces ingoldianus]